VAAIVYKLNRLGVPTRKGGQWSPGLVYPILKHEVYAGTWHGYRFQMVEKNGKKSRKRRPRDEWQAVAVPALVDRQTWEKAQARLADGRHEGRETAHHEYLLSGRIKCSCGYHIQGHPTWAKGKAYLYYACNGRHATNTVRSCDFPRVRVSVWDNIVWQWVYELMMHPERLAQGMREERDSRLQQNAHLYARLEQAKAKIAEYDLDLEELARQLYKRRISEAFHDREKAIVERARAEMDTERADLEALLAGTILTDEQIETFEQFAYDVRDGLAGATFEDKRNYLTWLDFSGRFAWENGEPVMYARLELVKGAEKRLREVSETH
jgi:site-specific DNA recombinase